MTVKELIKQLNEVKDKDLPVRVIIDIEDDANYWIETIEVSNTADSGYNVSGEVRLFAYE